MSLCALLCRKGPTGASSAAGSTSAPTSVTSGTIISSSPDSGCCSAFPGLAPFFMLLWVTLSIPSWSVGTPAPATHPAQTRIERGLIARGNAIPTGHRWDEGHCGYRRGPFSCVPRIRSRRIHRCRYLLRHIGLPHFRHRLRRDRARYFHALSLLRPSRPSTLPGALTCSVRGSRRRMARSPPGQFRTFGRADACQRGVRCQLLFLASIRLFQS